MYLSCLNCSTGRAGRSHNPRRTTRFQSQPVLNAAAAASTSKICPQPEFPSSCPPLRYFHEERETQALSVGNHQTTHVVGEIGLSRRKPQSVYGYRFSGPPSPSGGLNEPGKGSKIEENRHFSRLRCKDDQEEKDDGRRQGLDVCQGSDEERAYLSRSNCDPHGGRPDPLDRQMTSRTHTTSQTSHAVEGAVHACSALESCDAETLGPASESTSRSRLAYFAAGGAVIRQRTNSLREELGGNASKPRAGKIFSVPLATMEPLPKDQSPNWNQDLKPGRQSRTPKRTVAKRCKKNTRTGTLRLSKKCKTLCTFCTSKVFAEKLENKGMKG